MAQTTASYADWKAPAQDGEILIWPEPARLIEQTKSNQQRLDSSQHVLIQNTPLPELRRSVRQYLGHPHSAPLIASGHQSELYHPGVWAKDVLTNEIAGAIAG